ncbi:hypothetical protein, partial [Thermoclostridium caenicola]|uniref:hypothetical protein n=1 Tax=Thermoclostridium caenicola TaxID=659425 RepID=UPI001A9A9FF9
FFRCKISSLFHSSILTYFGRFVCLNFWYHYNSSHIAQVLTNIIEDNARLHEMKDYLIKNPFSNSIAINQLSKVFELNDDRLG